MWFIIMTKSLNEYVFRKSLSWVAGLANFGQCFFHSASISSSTKVKDIKWLQNVNLSKKKKVYFSPWEVSRIFILFQSKEKHDCIIVSVCSLRVFNFLFIYFFKRKQLT